MPTEKKDPIIIDGMPVYTLSSYEPVSVVVAKRDIGDKEVDAAVWGEVLEKGGTIAKMLDDEWIHASFPEFNSLNEMRDHIRQILNESNDGILEQRKIKECANALAERLEQRVLSSEIESVRVKMQQTFMEGLDEADLTLDGYMRRGQKTREDIERWFEIESVRIAKQMGALTAYAREKQISFTMEEVKEVVAQSLAGTNISIDDTIRQMVARGQLENFRHHALINKTVGIVMTEAEITYDYDKEIDEFDPINGYPTVRFF